MTRKEYGGLSLPKDLADEIDALIREGYKGYTSRAELVKDALRHFLGEIEKERGGYLIHLNPEGDFPSNAVKFFDRLVRKEVEIIFPKNEAFCKLCESYKCTHIRYMWSLPKVAEKLKSRGGYPPVWL